MHLKVWKIWGIWLWVRFAKGVLHGKPLSLSPLMATHSLLASLSCSNHTLSWRHQNRNSVGSMLCGCPTSFCWNLKERVSKLKKQVHVTYSGRLPSAFHLDLLFKKNIDKFFHLDSLMLWPQKEPGKCKACFDTDSKVVFGRPRWSSVVAIS